MRILATKLATLVFSTSLLVTPAIAGPRVATKPIATKAVATKADKRRAPMTDAGVRRAMAVIAKRRTSKQKPTTKERGLIARAEFAVKEGTPVPRIYQSLGKPGHRKYQTRLSLANPGDGHMKVTLKDPELLNGVIVHNETIERPGAHIAPYRMVSPEANAVLRLHVGDAAPVSVYFGRPNYKPDYRKTNIRGATTRAQEAQREIEANNLDMITAASLNDLFGNGAAEVKVALSGLSATSAVTFMSRVLRAANDRADDQFISGAFNVNMPIIDDRPETLAANNGEPVMVEDPIEIAKLGIELVATGGWQKVTWDGASDNIPSIPLIERLGGITSLEKGEPFETPRRVAALKKGRIELTKLVALAHAYGLETYISGGMDHRHMPAAVHAGVDGVGIGTSLHLPSTTPGKLGPLSPERVKAVITLRDAAEASTFGRGAKLLAKLTYATASGALSAADATLRDDLLTAMTTDDEAAVTRALAAVAN